MDYVFVATCMVFLFLSGSNIRKAEDDRSAEHKDKGPGLFWPRIGPAVEYGAVGKRYRKRGLLLWLFALLTLAVWVITDAFIR
jgi:hypothetical protein